MEETHELPPQHNRYCTLIVDHSSRLGSYVDEVMIWADFHAGFHFIIP